MNDGLMTIGTFSRASLLSIKALRAYHEAGILVPARVDPATGYRSYHAGQLTDAAVIQRLRALDLPLDRVREVVRARDPEVTRRVLAAHAAAMRARLDDVTRIVGELQEGVDRPGDHTPVHVRDEVGTHTLALRSVVREDEFSDFLGAANAALTALAARAGVAPTGPFGALYPPEVADEDAERVEAYLPIGTPAPLPDDRGDIVLSEVPAARVAVLVHAGDYESLGDTYRRLGTWVAHNARPAGGPVREIYLVSFDQTDDLSRFRTEIHWPIHEEST
ncbi:MAG TPA: MerR family transcriptional regulator [Acidimicrobiales bacterium]|nr:MerR family transcriptional regulator [Acidimicrobiales bacterium]